MIHYWEWVRNFEQLDRCAVCPGNVCVAHTIHTLNTHTHTYTYTVFLSLSWMWRFLNCTVSKQCAAIDAAAAAVATATAPAFNKTETLSNVEWMTELHVVFIVLCITSNVLCHVLCVMWCDLCACLRECTLPPLSISLAYERLYISQICTYLLN